MRRPFFCAESNSGGEGILPCWGRSRGKTRKVKGVFETGLLKVAGPGPWKWLLVCLGGRIDGEGLGQMKRPSPKTSGTWTKTSRHLAQSTKGLEQIKRPSPTQCQTLPSRCPQICLKHKKQNHRGPLFVSSGFTAIERLLS